MATALDSLLAVGGGLLVVVVLDAAVRTFVLPRGSQVVLTALVFRPMRRVFELVAATRRDWEGRDRVMAGYAPVTLLTLPLVWLVGVFIGFAAIFHAVEGNAWSDAFVTSGSSLLTLGFERPSGGPAVTVALAEALIGLALVALLIAYLPTIYNAFSRREQAVSQLSVRAGTPPTGTELLERAQRAGFLDRLDELFEVWEAWFVEVGETHTSLPVLTFFRSPHPHRSWVTASGAMLDGASLRLAVLDIPWTPSAGLCVRSGYMALREIADYFGVPYDPDPSPSDPISITRDEFDQAFDRIARAGTPVVADRDKAWRDFAGWRVNYDTVLLTLAGLVMASRAPWSSDRSSRFQQRVRGNARSRRPPAR